MDRWVPDTIEPGVAKINQRNICGEGSGLSNEIYEALYSLPLKAV
jgi:hypothetical protein